MIDLSNNNEAVNFEVLHAHRQYRVYLKRSEGTSFTDPLFGDRYQRALAAGEIVGAYHFARPSKNTPREEADYFLRLLPPLIRNKTLRPCLDLEDPDAPPSPAIGRWAEQWIALVRHHLHVRPIIYGGAYYLEPCEFRHMPTDLWLAAYGRNDGKEHPFVIPKPWDQTPRHVIAHQFASTARVPGCAGEVDISTVLHPHWLGVHRFTSLTDSAR